MKVAYLKGMFDGGGNYVPSNIGGGSSVVDISGGKKPFSETVVGQILDNVVKYGVSAAQIYQGFKDPSVTVIKDSQGNSHDISQLKAMVNQVSQQKNTSSDKMIQLMMMQLMKEKNNPAPQLPPKKDNTALYVGAGVLALVLIGGIVVLSQKK